MTLTERDQMGVQRLVGWDALAEGFVVSWNLRRRMQCGGPALQPPDMG